MLGNLELLDHQLGNNDRAKRRVQTIEKAALRAADLTRQLLGFSRRESSNLATADLNQVIRGMESLITRSVTPAVEVKLELAEQLWPADIDWGDLQDALMNLILNARDAMPNGGVLRIATANRTIEAATVEYGHVVDPGCYVELSVRDNGPGMPPDLLGRVFEPFFTTKPKGKGTGLGLSMVVGFVQRSRGYVSAYSEPGAGAMIQILLPCSESRVPDAPVCSKNEEALPGGEELILIVDDETDLLEIASQYLESFGYRTLQAENGEQALDQLERFPEIDLLFSDLVMPNGLNGYDLAGQARARHNHLKVLLASGFSGSSADLPSRTSTFAPVLSKPYNRAELARRVREILDS